MGAWGTGTFSDDTAADIRDTYREYLADSLDAVAATDKLLSEYSQSLEHPDDGPSFWLGLAAVQYRLGRLDSACAIGRLSSSMMTRT
jgi:hypothetical protein